MSFKFFSNLFGFAKNPAPKNDRIDAGEAAVRQRAIDRRQQSEIHSKRQIVVDPTGGFFDVRTLEKALEQAVDGDQITVTDGSYQLASIAKGITLVSANPGTSHFLHPPGATLALSGAGITLRGLSIGEPGQPASITVSGGVALEDCIIHGQVEVAGSNASLTLLRCKVNGGKCAVRLGAGTKATIQHTFLTGEIAGLEALAESRADLLNTHLSTGLPDGGSSCSLLAQGAHLALTECLLVSAHIGLHARDCLSLELLTCRISACRESALRIEGAGPAENATFRARNSSFTAHADAPGPIVAISGANLRMVACEVDSRACTAVHAGQDSSLDVGYCSLRSKGVALSAEPGVELSLQATQISGRTEPPDLAGLSTPIIEAPAGTKTDTLLAEIESLVGIEDVKLEARMLIERLLSAQQTDAGAIPPYLLHLIFTGPAGTGKSTVAASFCHLLHGMGILTTGQLVEISGAEIEECLTNSDAPSILARLQEGIGGLIYIPGLGHAIDTMGEVSRKQLEDVLFNFVEHAPPTTAIILEGDQQSIRPIAARNRFLKSSFTQAFVFRDFSPEELAGIFEMECSRRKLRLSDACSERLLLSCHYMHRMRHRNYANARDILAQFNETEIRYLKRIAKGGATGTLYSEDLQTPFAATIRRIPREDVRFTVNCPHCGTANPWIPNPPRIILCGSCDKPFESGWGHWSGGRTMELLPAADPAVRLKRRMAAARH